MSTTDTSKPRGTKVDFMGVMRLMEEARSLNKVTPGSGRPKMVEAKALFDQFDFTGLVAAGSARRTFETLGL